MSHVLETMKIVSENPKSQGPFILINKEDFDAKIHKEFKGKAKKAETEVYDEEAYASVAAVKAAEKAGLTSDQITGTGKDDKITAADVKRAVEAAKEAQTDEDDADEDTDEADTDDTDEETDEDDDFE